MSRIRIVFLVAALVAGVTVVGDAAAGPSQITEERTYIGGLDTPGRSLYYLSCDQPPYLGGACFSVPPGATSVGFRVDDATTTSPGALYRFLSPGGDLLAVHDGCEETELTVPEGTGRIQVFVNGPSTGLEACADPAVGTVGTITGTFTIEVDDEPGPGYTPSQPVHRVREEPRTFVRSAGNDIQVDVYRPDAPGPFPVLVWFDVYWKDDTGPVVNDERDHFVSRGYVFVHASSPGSNSSGGEYENAFGPQEQQAAYDVVEWAATQPWSNGRVGMEGLSYSAIIQYFVAGMRPPHLVTIYPTSAYSDLYREIVYAGGNLQAGYPLVWDANNRSYAYLPPTRVADDPATQAANYGTTVAGYRPILADFLQHPHADGFYETRSPATMNPQAEVPAAIDVGWHDDMVHGGPINFETLGSEEKRLVIGPWGHSEAHRRPDGRAERLRWFDHHLKGMPSGVDTDPRVKVFVPTGADDDDGRWITSDSWPLPGTAHRSLYLGEGTLDDAMPAHTGSASYDFLPTRHAMELGGEEVRFETAPLDEDLTVVGYPEVVLHGATGAPDTSWNVALYDVAPDGSAELLQRGWLRAAARELDPERSSPGRPHHRFARDLPVPADEVVTYRVGIWPFANTFPAGHRLRLTVSDSPSGPGGAPAFMPPYPTTNTVFFGPEAPSHLVLPVL